MKASELVQGFRRLSEHDSAPFEESAARKALHAWLDSLKLGHEVDAYGNTVVRVRRGMPRRPVAFVAHLDSPGLRVDKVTDAGVVCVGEGGLPLKSLKGAKISFPRGKNGATQGVVASVKTREENGVVKLTEAVVKLSAKAVRPAVGDFGVLDLAKFAKTTQRLKSPACDAFGGVVTVVATLAALAKGQAPCDAIGVFTRGAAVGFMGALSLAIDYRIPREAFVVSVEGSAVLGDIVLGDGPVVRLGDAQGPFDPRAFATVLGAAKHLADKKLKFQMGLMSGGTCEATPFIAFGYAAAGIALPLANYHCQGARGIACEEVDVRDIEGAVRLAECVALRAGSGTDDLDMYRNQLVIASQDGREKLRQPVNPLTGYPTGARF